MAEFFLEMNRWQFALALGAFVLVAGIEQLFPQRGVRERRWTRWAANLILFGVGFGALLLLTPLLMKGVGWVDGVVPMPLMVGLGMPAWLLVLVSFLVIDLIAYLNHMVFHLVPPLWRLHRTHHSDEVVDASTGVRHHPLETVVGAAVQLTAYAVLGLPLLVVVAYAVVVVVWQFLQHMDARLPESLDRVLRVVIVTPGMHRLHHSTRLDEGNSNFGLLLSIWDRLFGTYRQRPAEERRHMPVGVEGFLAGGGVLGPLGEPLRDQQAFPDPYTP